MLLIVHGKHHVQFDIRSRHHIAGIVVHGTHHRVCLRFGVVIAIVLGRKIDRQIETGIHELLAGLRRGRDGGVL